MFDRETNAADLLLDQIDCSTMIISIIKKNKKNLEIIYPLLLHMFLTLAPSSIVFFFFLCFYNNNK